MVLVNLNRLLLLIQACKACPLDIPKRNEKLYSQYGSFNLTSEVLVSIYLSNLERPTEKRIDDETEDFKKMIIFRLIQIFTNDLFELPPTTSGRLFLISSHTHCVNNDCGSLLVLRRPDRQVRRIIVYTRDFGPKEGMGFQKTCLICQSNYYPSFADLSQPNSEDQRSYDFPYSSLHFSATLDTYFETKYLENVCEDAFTLNASLSSIVEKYNYLHKTDSSNALNYIRLKA